MPCVSRGQLPRAMQGTGDPAGMAAANRIVREESRER
jgi:hypothetical protein